jgi:thiamine-phosphate pyrophosphorylase
VQKNILRIIDANLNRSREGLRVLEDIVRFILDDASLTRDLKSIRHRLQRIAASSKVNCPQLYEARDSEKDIGKGFSFLEKKKDWQSIFFANLQRIKESLRVLEEFFKLFDDGSGKNFKRLRFKIYEFEKKAFKKTKALSDYKYFKPKDFGFF